MAGSWAEKHMMSSGHVGGQGTRHGTGMTRTGPELSARKHQNCANKGQGGVMKRAGWRAQQTRQAAEWEATQKIDVAGIAAGQGNGVADDMMEGLPLDKGSSEGTIKGRRGWMVSVKARRKTGTNSVLRRGGGGRVRQGRARKGRTKHGMVWGWAG